MENRANPTSLADAAYAASQRGDYGRAAELYRQASGACIGHGRAARYMDCADECQAKANKEDDDIDDLYE